MRSKFNEVFGTVCMDIRLSQRFHEAYNEDIALLRGAMDAQDERERLAGKKCGVSYSENGCDWSDAVADKVIFLKEKINVLEEKILELRKELKEAKPDTRYRFCECGDYIREFIGNCPRCGMNLNKNEL